MDIQTALTSLSMPRLHRELKWKFKNQTQTGKQKKDWLKKLTDSGDNNNDSK